MGSHAELSNGILITGQPSVAKRNYFSGILVAGGWTPSYRGMELASAKPDAISQPRSIACQMLDGPPVFAIQGRQQKTGDLWSPWWAAIQAAFQDEIWISSNNFAEDNSPGWKSGIIYSFSETTYEHYRSEA